MFRTCLLTYFIWDDFYLTARRWGGHKRKENNRGQLQIQIFTLATVYSQGRNGNGNFRRKILWKESVKSFVWNHERWSSGHVQGSPTWFTDNRLWRRLISWSYLKTESPGKRQDLTDGGRSLTLGGTGLRALKAQSKAMGCVKKRRKPTFDAPCKLWLSVKENLKTWGLYWRKFGGWFKENLKNLGFIFPSFLKFISFENPTNGNTYPVVIWEPSSNWARNQSVHMAVKLEFALFLCQSRDVTSYLFERCCPNVL